MKLSTLIAGIKFFQVKLEKFVTQSEQKNKADEEKIKGIQSMIDDRKAEIKVANKLKGNITDLLDVDDKPDSE